ncbi:MAG TPA: hypothetical protein VGN26_22445 [Armatimonadota bacterium]|jgi:hypothetical protein
MRVREIALCGDGKARLVVEMPDAERCTTDYAPHIPRGAFRLFPGLYRHKCHNDANFTFREECENTEIPHLLEHLIIELQLSALDHATLRGETEWDWSVDPAGIFRVNIEYENECLVVGAIRLAERILNCIDTRTVEELDMEYEMDKLRVMAEIGQEQAAPAPAPAPRSEVPQPAFAEPLPATA